MNAFVMSGAMPGLVRLYLDESGTLGFDGEVFTMALVMVRDLGMLEASIARHRTTPDEVKASQMKIRSKLDLAEALLAENQLDIYLASLDPRAAAASERVLDKELLYDAMVAQALAYYLQGGELPRDGIIRVSMDMRGSIRESYEDYAAANVAAVLMAGPEPLVKSVDIRYVDSKYSAGVQVADLFSNIYRSSLANGDSAGTYHSFVMKLKRQGVVHEGFRFGLRELADQMSQIAESLRVRVQMEEAWEAMEAMRVAELQAAEEADFRAHEQELAAQRAAEAEQAAKDAERESLAEFNPAEARRLQEIEALAAAQAQAAAELAASEEATKSKSSRRRHRRSSTSGNALKAAEKTTGSDAEGGAGAAGAEAGKGAGTKDDKGADAGKAPEAETRPAQGKPSESEESASAAGAGTGKDTGTEGTKGAGAGKDAAQAPEAESAKVRRRPGDRRGTTKAQEAKPEAKESKDTKGAEKDATAPQPEVTAKAEANAEADADVKPKAKRSRSRRKPTAKADGTDEAVTAATPAAETAGSNGASNAAGADGTIPAAPTAKTAKAPARNEASTSPADDAGSPAPSSDATSNGTSAPDGANAPAEVASPAAEAEAKPKAKRSRSRRKPAAKADPAGEAGTSGEAVVATGTAAPEA